MDKFPILRRYTMDITFQIQLSLYFSVVFNVVYAIIKFAFSIYYSSVWFGSLAIYYLLLVIIRFALLRHSNKNAFGVNMKSERKQYRMCGGMLLLINLALSYVAIMVIRGNESFQYVGYLIYAMAFYAFYSIIVAIVSVFKYRKYNSPVISAAKVLQLATALVAILSLESALLAQFDDSKDDKFRNIMTGATAGGVCTIILIIAIYMIIHSNSLYVCQR